ncbi:MAG: hypothetical protein ACRYFX_02630 [Janthinobacterium lividum]
MLFFLRTLGLSVRRLPVYAGLLLLVVGGFGWLGWHGRSVWGDDNESTESVSGPSGRSHGSAGHLRYYHK